MSKWPDNPTWIDPSSINKGNEYVGGDGIYYSDLNAIVNDLIVIRQQLNAFSYSVNIALSHCTSDAQNPTRVIFAAETTLKFTADKGYDLPTTITITGATFTWNVSDNIGTLILKNPTNDVTGSIVATIQKYKITYNLTNARYATSNPETITYGGNVLLRFSTDKHYKLPDSTADILVVNARISAYTKTNPYIADMRIVDPVGDVTISFAGQQRTFPVQGNIISLDSKEYRVLKIADTVAEVVAMYDAMTAQVFSSSTPRSNVYHSSDISSYCNSEFYSSLSYNLKGAIVDKTFAQDSWYRALEGTSDPGDPTYWGAYNDASGYDQYYYVALGSKAYGQNITRHCYCLSVQDVLDYLKVTPEMSAENTNLTSRNIWLMFWNRYTSPGASSNIWLRSARADSAQDAMRINSARGHISYNVVSDAISVRPAFQVDLAGTDFTISE